MKYDLVINPSFLCPFACNFCFHKNKLSSNENLDLHVYHTFLKENYGNYNKIIISGGEPMALEKSYFNDLIDISKGFALNNVYVNTYPYKMDNYRNDVNYIVSYDFMVRPRATETWNNLISFPDRFNMVITLSPLMFKYHPNDILRKLSFLPKLHSVEFKPYLKNTYSEFDITKNETFMKFSQLLLNSQLNVPFKIINKDKMLSSIIGEDVTESSNLFLNPDGKLYYQEIENGILKFKEASENIFNEEHKLVYPNEINMYNSDMVKWRLSLEN